MNNKLFTTYLLKKFLPSLEEDLHFRKFGKIDLPDVPRWKPYWWRVREYFGGVWRALKGDCYCAYHWEDND